MAVWECSSAIVYGEEPLLWKRESEVKIVIESGRLPDLIVRRDFAGDWGTFGAELMHARRVLEDGDQMMISMSSLLIQPSLAALIGIIGLLVFCECIGLPFGEK